ncbi:MAG: right-handed parallel beta-helix repeat-containing protein [Leptospirales bacterium]
MKIIKLLIQFFFISVILASCGNNGGGGGGGNNVSSVCDDNNVDEGVFAATPAVCDYYVDDATGDDNDDGTTELLAWKTLDRAVGWNSSSGVDGKTVCVKNGTYAGVDIRRTGTDAANYLTIRAMAAHSPVVSAKSDTPYCFDGDTASGSISYVIIDGFDCTEDLADGQANDGAGIAFYELDSTNIIIRNNIIHDIGIEAPTEPNPGIIFAGAGTHRNILIENNTFDDNDGEGLYLGTATASKLGYLAYNIVVKNNTFTNNNDTVPAACGGLARCGEEAIDIKPTVCSALIKNNTIDNFGQTGSAIRLDGRFVELAYNTIIDSGHADNEDGSFAISFSSALNDVDYYDGHYIHHNVFVRVKVSTPDPWADSFILMPGCNDCSNITTPFIISHNTFIDAEKFGIFLNEETGAHEIKDNVFVGSADKHIKKHQATSTIIDNNAFETPNTYDVNDASELLGTNTGNFLVNVNDGTLGGGSTLKNAASDGTHIGANQLP